MNKTFGYLKTVDSSRNSAMFFALIIKKISLQANIINKNIKDDKFLQNANYEKLIENT